MDVTALLDDVADLVLGRSCLGCARPGPGLCPACARGLDRPATRLLPSAPSAPALSVRATTPYEGLGRRVVLEFKERGYRALARPLGRMLADAVASSHHGPVALVPVPGRPRSRRPYRAVDVLAQAAAREVAARGRRARVVPLLRTGHYAELKELGRAERARAVAGAFVARPTRLTAGLAVILVDDVLTTGATLGEAERACRVGGIRVGGAIVVAHALLPGVAVPQPG